MVYIIAALDKKSGIGKGNALLAHIKEDLKNFKKITEGNIVAMGYNTYMSLPKRPLPNRLNIVLTSKQIALEGAVVVHSVEELLSKIKELEAESNMNTFICGGASLYRQMLPYADALYITHIFEEFAADTFFPEMPDEWDIEWSSCKRENIYHEHPHIFVKYAKKEK